MQTYLKERLENQSNIDAILSATDNITKEIYNLILNKDIIITGQDGDSDVIELIQNHPKMMTVYKNSKDLAKLTAQNTDLLLKGNSIETSDFIFNGETDVKTFMCDVKTITQENYMEIK